ncbi:MAG: ornithine carbamoyltransferase [Chloroflexota bacterium]|jgi:ornithine carbamoyltransferase|nr:ornithine carbamoyltransferase [Chloroflexota bacterium]
MYSGLAGRDVLSIADLTREDIEAVLACAAEQKLSGTSPRPLEGKSVGMIFQRPSNRTRVSFEVAIHQLGGHPIPLFSQEIQLGERESVADIGRILDRYLDGIVARVYNQSDLEGMAASAGAPVINAMTDDEHPCQVLADLLTIREHAGDEAVVTYLGDGNNVCNSWILAAAIMGFELRLVIPEGYEPRHAVLKRAEALGATETRMWPVNTALADTDIIYTDVWTSMGQEQERERRRRDFAELQVNEELLKLAPGSARVMHCLPAHRGEEITDEVIDGAQSIVFDQAENRLHVQKALLTLIYAPLVG